ncbi:hypothetical protein, partial [Rhizobium ruizarguesonis]|uniref:hypothetical protein n=1 Tax=Rhizobium ruizarguesonis TaxID=2081791 RepID=UPI001954BDC7
RQNQPWREPIHPSSPPPKHYRQKNPIRKNKTRRKIDGFVSGLEAARSRLFLDRAAAHISVTSYLTP